MLKHQHVVVALGSNLGDRVGYCLSAERLMEERCGRLLSRASFYENAPIGNADQMFVNTAVICETTLNPHQFLRTLLEIEAELGRQRHLHWGNRTIDLDIVLWSDASGRPITIQDAALAVPHPQALLRDFVLVPVSEIAGEWIHPVTGCSVAQELRLHDYQLPANPRLAPAASSPAEHTPHAVPSIPHAARAPQSDRLGKRESDRIGL